MLLWHSALWFPTHSQSAHPPQSARFLSVYFHSAHSLSIYSQSARSQSARFSPLLLLSPLILSQLIYLGVHLLSSRAEANICSHIYPLIPISIYD